jgi:hypothetical protein
MKIIDKVIDGAYIRYRFSTGHYGYVIPHKSEHLTLRGAKGGLINPSSKTYIQANKLIK